VKTSPAMPVDPVKKDKKTPEKYEIEDAHRALIRAEEIKGDPDLMKHVLKRNKKQRKAMRSIEDLRKAHHEIVHENAGLDPEETE
jgi:hypothetical protein